MINIRNVTLKPSGGSDEGQKDEELTQKEVRKYGSLKDKAHLGVAQKEGADRYADKERWDWQHKGIHRGFCFMASNLWWLIRVWSQNFLPAALTDQTPTNWLSQDYHMSFH